MHAMTEKCIIQDVVCMYFGFFFLNKHLGIYEKTLNCYATNLTHACERWIFT
jgi:hypothetical protein